MQDSDIYEVYRAPVKMLQPKSKPKNSNTSKFKSLGFGKEDFEFNQPISNKGS